MFQNEDAKLSIIRKIVYAALPFLALLLLVIFYNYAVTKLPNVLPTGTGLYERAVSTFTKPIKKINLIGHVLTSLKRVLIALCFAWAFGIVFGVAIGWSKTLKATFGTIFEMIRPIPPIAWIPLIVMAFGIGETSKIILVFIGGVIPVIMNTQGGIRLVEKEYIDVGRLYKANTWQMLTEIVMPTAFPSIFAGIRTSVSTGWTVVLAAEMMGSDVGIGSLVTRGWNAGDMALVIVSIICIGIVGFILSFLLNKFERIVCPWNR